MGKSAILGAVWGDGGSILNGGGERTREETVSVFWMCHGFSI